MHASVYKCINRETQEVFAVKEIWEDDEEIVMIHENEFKLIKELNHENIIKVYDFFKNPAKKVMYILMDYVDGVEILDSLAETGICCEETAWNLF